MSRVPITLMGYRCDRCGHEWLPKKDNENEPKVCPKCKRPYDEFRDKIKAMLSELKTPMTWTEIRTKAKLPQKWPNNKWVRRMDKEIGLIREKDDNGIIKWRISL